MAQSTLPKTYKRFVGEKDNKMGYIEEVPLVLPGENEVLVKMAFAPLNPFDLGVMYGWYSEEKGKTTIGLEGSGEIVAIGTNLKSPHKVGDKVHVYAFGTWGQYLLAPSDRVFPIIDNISMEEAASHIINPGTVMLMARLAEQGKHKAAINTVGSSSLGRMLIRLFKSRGIKLINIVRKEKYVKELLQEGADYVLVSTEPDFEKKLEEIAKKEQATVTFDALGGDHTGKILKLLPEGSTVYVYDVLAGRYLNGIDVNELLFKGKTLKSYSLTKYIFNSLNEEERAAFYKEFHSKLSGPLKTKIQKIFPLEKYEEAIALFNEKSSEGKILFSLN